MPSLLSAFAPGELEWRPAVKPDQMGAAGAYPQHRYRAGVAGQPLEVIERQAQEVRHRQLDRIGVKDAGDHVPFLVVGHDPLQRGDDARLRLDEALAAGMARS